MKERKERTEQNDRVRTRKQRRRKERRKKGRKKEKESKMTKKQKESSNFLSNYFVFLFFLSKNGFLPKLFTAVINSVP